MTHREQWTLGVGFAVGSLFGIILTAFMSAADIGLRCQGF